MAIIVSTSDVSVNPSKPKWLKTSFVASVKVFVSLKSLTSAVTANDSGTIVFSKPRFELIPGRATPIIIDLSPSSIT